MTTLQFPSPKENLLPAQIPLVSPPSQSLDSVKVDRFKGSLMGMAVGDALGASVEFRPRQYLLDRPVENMQSGGTWGLQAGEWTDDTSMALCLASSLISCRGFDPYNQLVRYKWWYKFGYLSSTGRCFDIGNATRSALDEFCRRQNETQRRWRTVNEEQMDNFTFDEMRRSGFDVNCGGQNANGNGALMRLAPVPLFYYRDPEKAVTLSGESARLTHGDQRAIDACRYYGALIVAAVNGESKEKLLSPNFYSEHRAWFGKNELHDEILSVASGSFSKKDGYDKGIRGSGKSVQALEAALWAFYKDDNSFEKGVLKAVNLGDDTDTTGAIYGQLAGAYYGFNRIPSKWTQQLYAKNLISCIAEWLQSLGDSRFATQSSPQQTPTRMSQSNQPQQYPNHNTSQNPLKIASNPTSYQPILTSSSTAARTSQYSTPTTKPGFPTNNSRSTAKNSHQHSSSWAWYRHEQ
ncbi:unnamed protein product [Rotaria socialis]|uniref:ADP-ribosylglycohydrolase n=1 Tax=Rotaria socialis TaxID=392032 RepID=A0A821LG70_9BILA|nr:unnamed protein product [Rotaria socialis]CAF4750600.1 unnamed protein product [Rotaria socialis]